MAAIRIVNPPVRRAGAGLAEQDLARGAEVQGPKRGVCPPRIKANLMQIKRIGGATLCSSEGAA